MDDGGFLPWRHVIWTTKDGRRLPSDQAVEPQQVAQVLSLVARHLVPTDALCNCGRLDWAMQAGAFALEL